MESLETSTYFRNLQMGLVEHLWLFNLPYGACMRCSLSLLRSGSGSRSAQTRHAMREKQYAPFFAEHVRFWSQALLVKYVYFFGGGSVACRVLHIFIHIFIYIRCFKSLTTPSVGFLFASCCILLQMHRIFCKSFWNVTCHSSKFRGSACPSLQGPWPPSRNLAMMYTPKALVQYSRFLLHTPTTIKH